MFYELCGPLIPIFRICFLDVNRSKTGIQRDLLGVADTGGFVQAGVVVELTRPCCHARPAPWPAGFAPGTLRAPSPVASRCSRFGCWVAEAFLYCG